MASIDVQIDERAPARFELVLEEPDGERKELRCDDPYASLCEERAFALVMEHEVRPLPAGAIRCLAQMEDFEHLPELDAVGEAIARQILA